MIPVQCSHCSMDSAGNHERGCPLAPNSPKLVYDAPLRTILAEPIQEYIRALEKERDTLRRELEEVKASNQRERDLIRHCRMDLLEANLISEHEYALLAMDANSVDRLADYDDLRSKLAKAREALKRFEWQYAYEPNDLPDDDQEICFACENRKSQGHNVICWLAAVLKELD